jgi:nitroreductase
METTTWSLTRELALSLIGAAVLAPSSHNTQPWIFRVRERGIGVIADRTRALPANDPSDRELTISCACALFNLRVAAAQAGLAPTLHGPSGATDPDCLARLELQPAEAPDAALVPLFDAIASRRTYRRAFAARPVDPGVLSVLGEAASHEGGWLHILDSEAQRWQAVELVAEGDEMQWANPAWRRELAAWMHPRRRGDGLALPGLAVPLAQAVVRTFDMGHGVAARDRQLADGSPVLAVLGTAGDDLADWIAAGQALQRVLLTASRRGLQASYLNQPIQLPLLRTQLQRVIAKAGFPQVLLRLGHPDGELPPVRRRPLAAVTEFEGMARPNGEC